MMGIMPRHDELTVPAHCYPHEPLAIGARAPDFDWIDSAGEATSLAALRGQPVLLAFFAEDWDPAREQQLWTYNEMLRRAPGGGTVLGIAQSGCACDILLDGEDAVRVALLSDLGVDGEVPRRFGVAETQAIFVVDEHGVVRWRHIAVDGQRPALGELDAALAPVSEARKITRRAFLATTLAVSIALTVMPRFGRAQVPGKQAAVEAPAQQVTLNVNGRDYALALEPRVTLLDALRERMGLPGTKKGCDHGQCGACTVHIDGRRVNACLTLAVQAEGARIVTIEGLAQGGVLHPVQQAFVRHDGFQCGYCTSGQIMSAVACIEEGHAGNDAEIAEWMSGNICRCGAYNGIRAAVAEAQARQRRRS
jgi:xanthine dehydrogenase YagT iron-sulfur-binding subunit